MSASSRGDRAISWVEEYCLYPNGPERGQHVKLSQVQKHTVRQIYDHGALVGSATGTLAAYLALMHVCGPESVVGGRQQPGPAADILTIWNATGPALKEVLRRDGEHIVCLELGTCYPAKAQTAREAYMKELSENPRFEKAPKSGQTFGIVGAKPNRS